MDDEPEIPAPPPEVPRGKLWSALLIPPLVTVIGSIIAGIAARDAHNYGTELLLVLPVSLAVISAFLVVFILAWRVRYRGRGLVLTSIGYFLGQVILCLCLWFGCCFAVLS